MEKEFLVDCIDGNMSISQIGKIFNKAPTTIKYWLDKYGLKTKHKSFKEVGVISNEKKCPRCETTKNIVEFYKRRGKEGGSVYCKICTSEQVLERTREMKQQCVDYKGGKCESCGYDKYNGALEFHHKDPKGKDFSLSNVKTKAFNNTIKEELDKCVLLCANCHREKHYEMLINRSISLIVQGIE